LTVWLFDCLTVWLFDSLTLWLFDSLTVWLFDCLTVWLFDCLTVWLCDCLTVWLLDWLTDCLSGHDWLTRYDWLVDSLSCFVTEFRRPNCVQQTWQPATVFSWRVGEVQWRGAAGRKRKQRTSHTITWLVFVTTAGQQIREMSRWDLLQHTKFRSSTSSRRLETADQRLTCRNILNTWICKNALGKLSNYVNKAL